MSDLISRQDTVDVIASMIAYHKTLDDAYWYVKDDAPSSQPEIIRCRECKHMQRDEIFHQCWCNGNEVKEDHFCGYAERREDALN